MDLYGYENLKNIRYGLTKIMIHLAKSTDDGLYINSVKEYLIRAIKCVDYTIKFSDFEDKLEVIVIKK